MTMPHRSNKRRRKSPSVRLIGTAVATLLLTGVLAKAPASAGEDAAPSGGGAEPSTFQLGDDPVVIARQDRLKEVAALIRPQLESNPSYSRMYVSARDLSLTIFAETINDSMREVAQDVPEDVTTEFAKSVFNADEERALHEYFAAISPALQSEQDVDLTHWGLESPRGDFVVYYDPSHNPLTLQKLSTVLDDGDATRLSEDINTLVSSGKVRFAPGRPVVMDNGTRGDMTAPFWGRRRRSGT